MSIETIGFLIGIFIGLFIIKKILNNRLGKELMQMVLHLPDGKTIKTRWIKFDQEYYDDYINAVATDSPVHMIDDKINLKFLPNAILKTTLVEINVKKRFLF